MARKTRKRTPSIIRGKRTLFSESRRFGGQLYHLVARFPTKREAQKQAASMKEFSARFGGRVFARVVPVETRTGSMYLLYDRRIRRT